MWFEGVFSVLGCSNYGRLYKSAQKKGLLWKELAVANL
jgi:hypothetical protein